MALVCVRLFKPRVISPLTLSRLRTAPSCSLPRFQPRTRLRLSCTTPAAVCHSPASALLRSGEAKTLLSTQRFPVITESVRKFHTSNRLQALPAPLLWLVVKPLQKVAAIILGRSIRKWWMALPPNKKQLFREWVRQRRWHLAGAATGILLFLSLFFFTHLEECPLTGRSRFLVFSKESFMEMARHASCVYMEEYETSLLPVSDARHQVVERVVQHLIQRNQDIEGIKSLEWSVHIVDSPTVNAFVLPNGKVFMFTGMLEAVSDIHQLTFVLGHEMAHALIGHAAEQASMSHVVDLLSLILLTMIWAICPRDSLAVLGQWIQGKLVQFMFDRPFSRKLETEADQIGLQLAAKACADVRAGPVFWLQMDLTDKLTGEPKIPEWLSTHPSHHNRIANLDRFIPEALELRAKCDCPRLPGIDPRVVFSMTRQKMLENKKKQESKEKEEETERTRATVPVAAQHHGLEPQISPIPQILINK